MSTEPPLKKIKTDNGNDYLLNMIDEYIEDLKNSKKALEAVVSDDVLKKIPVIKAYVGHVKDPKDLSRIIAVLNEKVPLKDLSHLKRVRKRDVLLCPIVYLNGMSSIQEYIECHVNELNNVFEYFKELEIPYLPPKLILQFQECSKFWSCNFHPNSELEKRVNGTYFLPEQMNMHKIFMTIAFETCKFHLKSLDYSEQSFKDFNAAVVVDPLKKAVVAVAFDLRHEHPTKHAAMVAIDNVAKTQKGGAWQDDADSSRLYIFKGIDENLALVLKAKFPTVSFCARACLEKSDDPNGPYLCTNYDVYVIREPCFMCSMGLVHARAKTVFFCFENKEFGALKSKSKLHTVTSLNHRYNVFTRFL